MEVRNRGMKKLNDAALEEVSGGLELKRPLNTSLLTDDKIKKENEIQLKKKHEISQV